MARKKKTVLKALTGSGAGVVVAERTSRHRASADRATAAEHVRSISTVTNEKPGSDKLRNLCKPLLESQFATAPFSQEIEDQLNAVHDLDRVAWYNPRTGMALEILTTTRDFLSLLVDLFIIRRAFDLAARRSLEGVAPILGVAKATVQNQLAGLGLDSTDFRDPLRSMGDLIRSSEPLRTLIARLLELREKYQDEIAALPKAPTE